MKIMKRNTFTSLPLEKMTEERIGSYRCRLSNFLGPRFGDFSDGSIRSIRRGNVQVPQGVPLLTYVAVLIGISVLVVSVVVVVVVVRSKTRSSYEPVAVEQQTVYVSHYTTSHKQRQQLIHFAYQLEQHFNGMRVVLDLTREVEINAVGGLAQWVPMQMSGAGKILVVLSSHYTKVANDADHVEMGCNDREDGNAQSAKVAMEYRIIKGYIHERDQRAENLVVMKLEGNGSEGIPVVFQGRTCYNIPANFKSFLDSPLTKILTVVQHHDGMSKV